MAIKYSLLALSVGVCLASPQIHANDIPSNTELWQMIKALQKENAELKSLIEANANNRIQSTADANKSSPSRMTLPANADEINVSFNGFVRAEYGTGDRYSDRDGKDRLGVSKAALATTAIYKNIKGVLVVGTEVFTGADESNDFNGDVDVKDAFVVVDNVAGSGFGYSLGAQPLLFGLKPNGYPGDRSLQGSIEYGGAGAFAVSNQAGPSVIGFYNHQNTKLRFGFFDLSAQAGDNLQAIDDGSSLTDNFFVQLRNDRIGGTNFYGNVGFEQLYVGSTDSSETIWTIGGGWKNEYFDISAEYVFLDQAIAAANLGAVSGGSQLAQGLINDDENYLITEFTWFANEKWQIYFDYAKADELDANTIRLGAGYQFNKLLSFNLEYSDDDVSLLNLANGELDESVSSIDLRATVGF